MDLSDGLSLDLAEAGARIRRGGRDHSTANRSKATLDQALHGGEDYELLFTVRQGQSMPAKLCGVRLTKIGQSFPERQGLYRSMRTIAATWI
jgi:thiamine-monophosphate kinase